MADNPIAWAFMRRQAMAGLESKAIYEDRGMACSA
jgi:hypothetical protein